MLKLLNKLIRKSTPKNQRDSSTNKDSNPGKPLYKNFDRNTAYLKSLFKECDDIYFRRIKIAKTNRRALIVFVDGMANQDSISNNVIRMLANTVTEDQAAKITETVVEEQLTTISNIKAVKDFDAAVEGVLSGEALLLVEGVNSCFVLETRQWEGRPVAEPVNEQAIRGPREGFNETLRTNTSLVRRRIKNNDLKITHFKIGRESKTDVAVLYLANTADEKVVQEVKKRIGQIDIDAIVETSYIEELIEERTISIFPQMLNTERPDRVVGHLLEGKVVVMVDGSPFGLIMPVTLAQFFHSPDDYYNNYIFATFNRAIRLIAFFVATSLPSIYVILTGYRYEMIPRDLTTYLAEARAVLPFSPFAEALIMELTVEFLREATLRLPGPLGQTVGIVGALVIGDAAIQANLVGPLLVIFVSLTMLGSFIIPNYSMATTLRVFRFVVLIATGAFGGFGFVLVWMLILTHLCNLESFGVPYLQPFAPFKSSEQGDNVYRMPWRWFRRRPIEVAAKNVRRQRGEENKNNE